MTITITGTNDRPKLEVGDPDKTLYESGVGRDPATGVPVGDPGHENDPYDNATAGTHTTTGTITASDVDLGNTLHFAVSKKGEATEVPQDKLTDTDRSVTAQGSYGKLVVQETGNGEATYTYTLNENSDDIPLSVPVTINGTTYDDLEALKDALQFDGDRLTLNNLPEGATVTDTFTIFVQDDKGAWVSKDVTITITGTNDQPTVELDREHSQLHLFESGVGRYENGDIVRNPGGPDENNAYNGSTELTGKVTGADVDAGYELRFGVAAGDKSKDGSWEGADAPGEDDFLEQDSTTGGGGSKSVVGTFGTLTLSSDGTWVYTLKGEQEDLPEGVEIALDGKIVGIGSIDELPEGAEVTDTFTIYVKDEHGAWNLETVTITITGTNDRPKLEVGDPDKTLYESGVGRDPATGVPVGDPGHENDPYDNATAGTHTTTGTITASDVDLGNTLHFAVSKKGEATEVPQDKLTDGKNTAVMADGQFGTLKVTEGEDGEATYTYTLNEDAAEISFPVTISGITYASLEDLKEELGWDLDGDRLTLNNLPESATVTDSFTIFVQDDKGAWVSKDVTITIKGTNDQPELEVLDDKTFFDASGNEVSAADGHLHAYGTADTAADAVVKLTGRVQASDVDLENGGGKETTSGDNHGLEFSLQEKGYDSTLTSSSVWTYDGKEQMGAVNVTQNGDGWTATTPYGTLTLDQYGNYTYELHEGDDVTALGKGETVTETFVVRVVDDRGAWSEKTITITIEGTDDKPVLSDDTKSTLDVYEAGVWGSKPGATDPDKTFTGDNTLEATVTFEKQDAHDTHSLVIAGDVLPVKAPLAVTDGETSVAGATYTITDNGDGTYKVTATIPGVNNGNPIRLGTLTLEQNGTDGDLIYSFSPDQGKGGLDGLPQDMDLKIDIPLKVEDQNGNRSDGEHTATINIHGTNDRPTINFSQRAPEDVYADGVGREENGSTVRTPDKMELNPAENEGYTSTLVSGKLTASDVDADNDGFTFYVAGAQATGKSDIPLKCTANGDDTVTLTLDGVEVAKLVLNQTTGKYTLELLEGAKDALKSYGEDTEFSFKVTFKVKDEHGSSSTNKVEQTFTIHGTNDAPEITAVDKQDLAEDEASVTGNVTASDADSGDKLTYGLLSDSDFGRLNGADPESVDMTTSLSNEFGTLKIDPATGKYTFYLDAESEAVISLPEGEEKELTFHVAVRDDKGAWDVKDITVTITGKDTATVFTGDAAAVVSVVEAGVVPDMHPGTENQSEDGSPVASGKLEAKEYDTDADGTPHKVEFSINKTESGQEPKLSDFSSLGPKIQDAISQQFPGEPWGDDADIQIMHGQYGTLYLNTATGQYFYQLSNNSDATNALKQGEIRYDDFSIHAQGTGKGDAQGADQPLKVAVKGSNDAPKVTGVTLDEGQTGLKVSDDGFTVTGIVEDGGIKTVTGQIGATDVDSPDGSAADEGSVLKYLIKVTGEDGSVRYVGAQSAESPDGGEYGYLKLNEKTGEYTFVFNNKAAQHLGAGGIGEASFTVVVLDEYNAISEEKELTFEITGKDDAPRISGSAASITENTETSVNIQPVTITDPDARDEQHITSIASRGGESVDLTTGDGPWKIEGGYGTLTVTRNENGSLSYTYQLTEEGRNELQSLNEDGAHTSVKENFTVMGNSGGQSVTGGITVTINGVNDAPTLELRAPDGQAVSAEHPVEVKDWNPVKGTAAGDDVDDAEGDLRYSVDDADSATAAQDGLQTIKGEFGYLTIDAQTGKYTYVVDPFSEEYQKLQTGAQGKEHFTITVTDPYGATGTKEIVFDVTKVEGGTGPGSIELQLQKPGDSTDVTEDGGSHEVILPPSVASDFTELKDSDGKPVKVDADDIWLVDNKGQSGIVDGDMTHVVQTEYGSLILEKGDDDQWGYRFVLNNSSDIVQSLDEGYSIEKTFYVSVGTNPVPIHVTITGINDQPVIESVGHLSIEDTGGIVTGRVTTTDPDAGDVGSQEAGEGSGQTLFYAVSAVEGSGITLTPTGGQAQGAPGTYTLIKDGTDWGEFMLNKDGSYSFKPNAEAEKLLAGENANFNLTITVDDGSDAPNSSTKENLHITITGTNEAPVISGGELTLEATEDTAITVGDKLGVSDDRVNEGNLSYSVAAGEDAASSNASNMAAGQYGTLFINADGTYSYQLNNQLKEVQQLGGGDDEEPLTETFTIFVKDQDGAEVAKTITVTINGTNDAPVLSLDKPVLTIKEGTDAPVTGNASATDVDKDDTLSYGLKEGTLSEETGEYAYETDYGTFYINKETGAYRFKLNNTLDAVKNLRPTDVVDAKVTVVVDDGHGGVTEKELTVHIKGSDSVPEITDEGSLAIDVAEEPGSESEGKIQADGWDRGPDGTHDDPLHYAAQGAQPVTIDGQVWQMVTGEYGTLYLDPKTGKYRYELTEDMNHLADGETVTESFDKITIADSTGNKITETITVTIKGSNDAPEIAVSQPSGALAGTVTITDVDATDTHDVTFTGLYGSEEGAGAEGGGLLKVDLETLKDTPDGTKTLDVFNAAGEKIGELTLTYSKGGGAEDQLKYKFKPDPDYVNGLEVGKPEDISFGITVSDNNGGTVTTGDLQFTVTNENDAPEITASEGPSAEKGNTGTLVFMDDDVRDTHSVTFDGLQDTDGAPLTVELDNLPEDGKVAVFQNGLQIGTLTLSYDSTTGELTYTLSTEGFENNLPVGDSTIDFTITVSDKSGDTDTTDGNLQFTVTNDNDAPVIDEDLSQDPAAGNTGTLVFTDADVKDTHSVSFEELSVDEDGTPLTVDLDSLPEEPITVYQDGQKVGELILTYSKGEDGTGTFTYAFDPDKNYLNSLPVGENKLDFGITVSDKNGREDTTGDLQFTVTNDNDAPAITEEPSSGSNTGTLVFSDADVRDMHSVTFEGLYASESGKEGDSLKVDNVEGLTDGATTLDVYNESGQKIGTLKLAYTEGDGAGTEHTLTYTFTPDTEYSNSLDRDSSVSLDFDLKIHDDTEDSNTVKGSVTIESTNQAPVIGAPVDGGSNTGTVAITDSDPDDSLTVSIKDGEGNIRTITAEAEVVDGVSYTYTDGTLRYEVLPERTDDLAPGEESTVEITVFVDDGHGKVEQTVSLPVTSTAPTEGGEGEGATEGETVIVPDDGDQASLKAYGQRQRLAAEEAGLLTAAASFVAGITPEPVDPETFLQESVPAAQDDIPEALMAEEIPLPQDETVLQEETADLPDADVPVSEMPLADDLLAEPLLFAGLENADEMPEPVETLRPETADDTLLAEETDPATAGTPPAFGGEEAGDDGLLLPEGVEGLFGTDGDDYLRGGEGSDAIFGGAGNDIIVYDQQDYLVSGGSGIDFMVSDDTSLTLDGLLSNTSSDKPLVSGIEVLLKGEDALSLTSINDLADRYGITLGVNEAGEETLQLDDRWTKQEDGSYDFNGGAEADGGLTLETNLTPVEAGDPASEAVQQQVFTLEHSNG
ncbi:MAG: VCBS domain-containing protein [Desulfovibrio piger]|uniref:VCBS domain-containing protein n=1 Tax=Desulfovibrio piger TaxID=901 RepID=UPI0026EDA18F|nr:VCBS domain-containing protein [Desulfovibrio piger]MCI7372648.1 VCBS domain-containing protein [Desulfovibrio piger]